MIYSSLSNKYFSLAVIIGFVSMLSFVILVKLVSGELNTELTKVMRIDFIGIVVLTIGCILYYKPFLNG